jgi:hypothetical protein
MYSPEENVFFDKLKTIIQFIIKDPNKSLEPVWKIQDSWTRENGFGAYIVKLHHSVISFVNELAPEHVDFLISDTQVQVTRVVVSSFPRFLYCYLYYLSRHVGSLPITRNATHF